MKRRIIRADALNWAIQEFQEGGETIERGRYAGQKTQAKWKQPESFFRTLPDAARAFFHDTIGDLPIGEQLTGEMLVQAVSEAETRTVEAVKEAVDALETSMLIGIVQERGYSVTDGKKGRTTYVEE
jgi:hypothetical protein